MTHTAPLDIIVPAVPAAASPRRRTAGIVMAVASALAFSSIGPLVKPLLEAGWSLSAALIVRMGLAGLILSPALVRALRDGGVEALAAEARALTAGRRRNGRGGAAK